MSQEEKRRIAYHETGHAYAQIKLQPKERLSKVTIIRHGSALGLSAAKPLEEQYLKTKEELLTSILNPSYAIEPHYVHYVVTTKDGEIHDGVIAGETPGAITLRGGTEGDETILRQNVANVRASTVSLMPEGLEQSMSRQDIADVIAYLRAGL